VAVDKRRVTSNRRLEHGWDECGGFVVWKLAMKPNVFAIRER
jgi:hypothetical protein